MTLREEAKMFGNQSRKAQHIREDLLRRNGHGVFEHCLNLLSDDELIRRHDQFHAEKLARLQAETDKARRTQAGESLIGVLILLLIVMAMAAALAPNAIRATQSKNAGAAAAWAMSVNNAEWTYQSNGGYVPPQNLTGVLGSALPACANPLLLPGGVVGTAANPAAPAMGYTYTFTGAGTATVGAGCPPAFLSYTLLIDPTNSMEGGHRHFFTCTGDGCDGQIHFRDGLSATDHAQESDPIYSTTAVAGGGGNGSGGNTSPSTPTPILTGSWNPSGTYLAGQEVTYANGTNSIGLFANLTGQNSASSQNPAGDASNWIQIASYSTAPPSLTGSFTGVQLIGGSDYTCPVSGLSCAVVRTQGSIPSDYTTLQTSFTMTQFTVTMSPQNGASALSIFTQPLQNPSGPANLGCVIPANGTTCTVNISPVVLPAGSGMEIIVVPSLSYAAESIVWSIS
jgi:type II secretory pathway pseudopilin PulG